MRKISALLLALMLLVGCGTGQPSSSSGSQTPGVQSGGTGGDYENIEEGSTLIQFQAPAAGSEIAVMKTSMGDIEIMFFPEVAPLAVENFVTHAKEGYYNGLKFHRVIEGFMLQGGDPLGTGTGGESIWGEDFEDEFSSAVLNFRGALSMANSGANTNGSQFFIVQAGSVDEGYVKAMENGNWPAELVEAYKTHGGTPWLDGRHTVFGMVVKGMDVVDAIAAVKTDAADMPIEDVIITEITFFTAE